MHQLCRISLGFVTFFLLCVGYVSPALADSITPDQVPFTATFSAFITSVSDCSDEGGQLQFFSGTGTASFLGPITASGRQCVDLESGSVNRGMFTFTMSSTGASGDSIIGQFMGTLGETLTNGVLSFDISAFTITGGGGIFTGAMGSGTGIGTYNFLTSAAIITLTGNVTAPIPEPATILMLGTGLAIATGAYKRRRAAKGGFSGR